MTPQEHIDAIGEALKKLEISIAAQEESVAEAKRLARRLHKALDRAQRAYSQEHGNDDNVIVLYSTTDGGAPGGIDGKPDPDEPEEP